VDDDIDGEPRPLSDGYDIGADETALHPIYLPLVLRNEDHPEWCGFSNGSESAIWNYAHDCAYLRDSVGTLISAPGCSTMVYPPMGSKLSLASRRMMISPSRLYALVSIAGMM
jgi:hypothetical protein